MTADLPFGGDGASSRLRSLSDDELLDAWRRARRAAEAAPPTVYGQRMFERIAAEAAAIERFGKGEHRAAYLRRFPDDRF